MRCYGIARGLRKSQLRRRSDTLTISMPNRALLIAFALAVVCASSCRGPGEPRPAASVEPATLAFAIDGRTNDSPSVAAFGKTVAVVWTARRDQGADIYISVSADSGATFAPAIRVNDTEGDARASGEQPARVVVAYGGIIHVVWPTRRDGRAEIRYASSTDTGKSFSKTATIAGEREPGIRGWQSVAIGYDGGVHAVWLDGRNAAPRPAGTKHQHGKGGEAPRQDVIHAAWKGNGPRTENAVATSVCFCCKTAIVTTGDRVYAAFRNIYPGSLRDISVARSIDNGATFQEPIRLSEDGWRIEACPDDGPAMATDSHGGLHITWPTMLSGETPRKGIFYASMPDAATTATKFSARLRLDAGDGDPAHPQIASDEHGISAVIWDERLGDQRRVVLRRITEGKATAPEIFTGAGLSYPSVAAAEGHWVAVWAAQGAGGRTVIEGRRLAFAASH
jgi:hypothetical protein